MSLPAALTAALLAGLLAIERKAFLQAALSRPLVASTLLGLVFGEPALGLSMGAALELFFLGAVHLGAVLPDNELFTASAATGCAAGLVQASALPAPAALAVGALIGLPAARLGRWADRGSERLNARLVARLEAAAPARLGHGLYGMWVPFGSTAAMALAGALVGGVLLVPLARSASAALAEALAVAWTGFLLVAAASALQSIRAVRAGRWAAGAALLVAGVQLARELSG
jgi:hypothetical protein